MSPDRVRLAELVAGLSVATDFGKGLPDGQAMRTCLLAMSVADAMELSHEVLHDLYYVSLLRFVGCTATASDVAAAFGDELDVASAYAGIDTHDLRAVVRTTFGVFASDLPLPTRLSRQARMMTSGPRIMREHEIASCDVAQFLGRQLGLPERTLVALAQVFERWDGRGNPGEVKGADLALAVRIEQVCHAVEILLDRVGPREAIAVLDEGAGSAYDPDVVEVVCRRMDEFAAALAEPWTVDMVLAAEPQPWRELSGDAIDAAARALGAFADVKSPWLVGHSDHVARIASAAGERLGFAPQAITDLRRAAWVHDVGRAAVSSAIWNRPGKLSSAEWEQVRLHGYYTGRVLSQSPVFARLEPLASAHHERADGSGYHRGLAALDPLVAVLAAADAFAALQETRSHRPGLPREAAVNAMRREVLNNRLDAAVVDAVCGRAISEPPPSSTLSARECEVLTFVARGLSNKQVAERLHLSPKTINAHLEHSFTKLGVSSRAAAVFAAAQLGLITAAVTTE